MSETIQKRQHTVNSASASPVRSPAGDAVSYLAFQVLRLSAHLTTAGDELAKPAGQTSARWQVLAAVERAPSTVADIARALGLARQSVQRVADLLAGEGFVAYEENPEHQRAKLVRITASGLASLQSIQRAQISWANTLAEQLNVADVRKASEVLDAMLKLM